MTHKINAAAAPWAHTTEPPRTAWGAALLKRYAPDRMVKKDSNRQISQLAQTACTRCSGTIAAIESIFLFGAEKRTGFRTRPASLKSM